MMREVQAQVPANMVNAHREINSRRASYSELSTKSSCLLSLRPVVAACSPHRLAARRHVPREVNAHACCLLHARSSHFGRIFCDLVAGLGACLLEMTMNSPATTRPRRRSRPAMIAAGVFAMLASLAVTAPAQAGYYGYGDSYYGGPRSCGGYYRCGGCGYRCGGCGNHCGYVPYRSYHGCCYRRSGVVFEKRYIEREFVVRRYGYGGGGPYYGSHYGYRPYGGYGGYGRGPFPYGYGGVRDWGTPYGSGYGPSGYGYAEGPEF
jgi:hypothetical protein